MKDKTKGEGKQASRRLGERLGEFVEPLLRELDKALDKRLVRTFEKALQAVVKFRQSSHGLLLSELGGYITSPESAPAGTKRLSNLLRSPKWDAGIIE
jgi:hypothetical protein